MKTLTKVLILCACVLVAAGLGVGIYFVARPTDGGDGNNLVPPDPYEPFPPSESLLGVYWDAAVTTNGAPCAIIGRDILMKNGNAVDAAIAALFCEEVTCLQSMGLGGGFLMTIYLKEQNKAISVNARETAPAGATKDMFNGDSEASRFGGLAVAVPGQLKGYWELKNKYGSANIPWKDLIEPTIKICEEGSLVTPYVASILKGQEQRILNSPSLREIAIDPVTNHTWGEGQRIKRLMLADTLRVIAAEGGDALYTGSLAAGFVQDIKDFGGIITMEDMANYTVKWEPPVEAHIGDGMKMYTVPPPGSGPLVTFILNVLNGFVPAGDAITTHQRIAEAMKYAFGKRTELGDPDYTDITELVANLTSVDYAESIRSIIEDARTSQDPAYYGAVFAQPDDHGTAHISVIAPNGDAVSVTSTINQLLGAQIVSPTTGIILNDAMDDFAVPGIINGYNMPPSPANFIEPGKRPLSSICPAIFVDKEGVVQLVVGSAGGPKITTALALVAINNLWFNMTIKEALDAHRFHHQVFPMNLQYEYGMPYSIVKGLSDIGHNMTRYTGGSSVTAIARAGGMLHANTDHRRGGITAGF